MLVVGSPSRQSSERLLFDIDGTEMEPLSSKHVAVIETEAGIDGPASLDSSSHRYIHPNHVEPEDTTSPLEYRVYKRRFFGLFQLVLLNIVVSWDVCCLLPSYQSSSRHALMVPPSG